MSTRNCLSVGDNALFSHKHVLELRCHSCLIFEHNFEFRRVQRGQTRALLRRQPDPVLLCCDECFSRVLPAKLEKLVEIGIGVSVVITKF